MAFGAWSVWMACRTIPISLLLLLFGRATRASMARDCTRDLEHFGHPADHLDHAREVFAVANPQLEHQRRAVGILLLDRHALDVRVSGGDRRGHRREHA